MSLLARTSFVSQFRCSVCAIQKTNVDEFELHVKLDHLNWLPFECRLCSTKRATAAQLREHLYCFHQLSDNQFVYIDNSDAAKKFDEVLLNSEYLVQIVTDQRIMNIDGDKNIGTISMPIMETNKSPSSTVDISVSSAEIQQENKCEIVFQTETNKCDIIIQTKEVPSEMSAKRCTALRLSSRTSTSSPLQSLILFNDLKNETLLTEVKTEPTLNAEDIISMDDISLSPTSTNSNEAELPSESPNIELPRIRKSTSKFDLYKKSPSKLKKKQRSKAGSSLYKKQTTNCLICERKVKVSKKFEHIRRHHIGEKPFSCSLCPYMEYSNSVINAHIRKAHSGEGKPVYTPSDDYHVRVYAMAKPCFG